VEWFRSRYTSSTAFQLCHTLRSQE
jgi:hypothetical protein